MAWRKQRSGAWHHQNADPEKRSLWIVASLNLHTNLSAHLFPQSERPVCLPSVCPVCPPSVPTFELQDAKGQLLEKVNGKVKCKEPIQLKTTPQGFPAGYPSYQAIVINGVTEIVEYKKMEPRFYVTDDPVVWKQYREIGCGRSISGQAFQKHFKKDFRKHFKYFRTDEITPPSTVRLAGHG